VVDEQVGAAVLPQQLTASAARHQRLPVRTDTADGEQPAATTGVQRRYHAALGAQPHPVGGVLHVAAGHDPAVVDQGRGPVVLDPEVVRLGGLVIDLAAKTVTVDGDGTVRLTPTEWHLLEVLLRNPGKLLTQRQLLTDVWGPGYADASGNLRLYMAQLRRKLEPDPAQPRWLLTEPGMGYRFQPGGEPEAEKTTVG